MWWKEGEKQKEWSKEWKENAHTGKGGGGGIKQEDGGIVVLVMHNHTQGKRWHERKTNEGMWQGAPTDTFKCAWTVDYAQIAWMGWRKVWVSRTDWRRRTARQCKRERNKGGGKKKTQQRKNKRECSREEGEVESLLSVVDDHVQLQTMSPNVQKLQKWIISKSQLFSTS